MEDFMIKDSDLRERLNFGEGDDEFSIASYGAPQSGDEQTYSLQSDDDERNDGEHLDAGKPESATFVWFISIKII